MRRSALAVLAALFARGNARAAEHFFQPRRRTPETGAQVGKQLHGKRRLEFALKPSRNMAHGYPRYQVFDDIVSSGLGAGAR